MKKLWLILGIVLPILGHGQVDSIILIQTPITGSGQIDTTLTIDFIDIVVPKLRNETIGSQTVTYSNQTLQSLSARNIAELLQQESGIFIKNYGSGSLATSSIRGGNAGHTLVLWNDLPIQSPMLGLLDLSLLPTNLSENISVQKGGGTAKWGSGAVGGVISMNNSANFNNRLSANNRLVFGSFGLFQQDLVAKVGTRKFQSHTKISHQKADNDFTYQLTPDFERTNENAQFQQQNFLQDFYFKPKSNQKISTHFWYQKAERQIPPTTVQTRSAAHQFDEAYRLIIDYNYIGQSIINTKVAYFKEHLNYFDDLFQSESYSDFSTFLGEFDIQKYFKHNQKVYFGTTHTLTRATIKNYVETQQEYRAAIFGTYYWGLYGFATQITLRQEMNNGVFAPLTPMLEMKQSLAGDVEIKAKVSRNYRLPTLNDRFWQPGGNPDLLPESGWSQELSLNFDKNIKQLRVDASITGFNRNINNWILWTPTNGQGFWSATNIAKVWSRGVESSLKLIFSKNDWEISTSFAHNWVRSTNEIAVSLPTIPENQQLFYTPEHQAFGKIQLGYKRLFGTYYHNYTSSTIGINENLPAYQLGSFQLRYDYQFKKIKGNILFNIQNIWNTDYFIVERRPIAGRNFQITFVVR